MTSIASTAATLAVVVFLGAGVASGQSAPEHHPEGAPAGQGMPMQPGMMGQGMGPGMMGQMPGAMGQGIGPGMMGQGGMSPMGPHMMSPAEMQHMMAHMSEMMGQGGYGMGPGMMGRGMQPGMMGQMAPGTMGPGMMGPGTMGPGMMGPGMQPGMMGQMGPGTMGPGIMGMQGLRVVPTMHLSTDDVRQFLQRHITAQGLTRLQVGEVTATDDETITADIVTREGSLALRLEIDAYTGFVKSVS